MKLSLPFPDLVAYIQKQFYSFFPDRLEPLDTLAPLVQITVDQIADSFGRSRMKFAFDDEGPCFSHRNTDQYALFLCFLAQAAYRVSHQADTIAVAEKAYAMNKALHGLDVFYEIELPRIMAFAHPVGTVLGRGRFDDYLCIYQGVTIGANLDDVYPTIGRGVVLYAGSAVMGNSRIGDNCLIAAGSLIMDTEVPDNHVCFGRHPDIVMKPTRRNVVRDIFHHTEDN